VSGCRLRRSTQVSSSAANTQALRQPPAAARPAFGGDPASLPQLREDGIQIVLLVGVFLINVVGLVIGGVGVGLATTPDAATKFKALSDKYANEQPDIQKTAKDFEAEVARLMSPSPIGARTPGSDRGVQSPRNRG
jgi:hypothetical protein